MKVVVLAGGIGTRLTEETEIKPKPMVEIGGRPILWHIMKHYAHYGHRFRALTIVDNYSRECLAIEAGQSITGHDVAAVMQRLVKERGVPSLYTMGLSLSLRFWISGPMIME